MPNDFVFKDLGAEVCNMGTAQEKKVKWRSGEIRKEMEPCLPEKVLENKLATNLNFTQFAAKLTCNVDNKLLKYVILGVLDCLPLILRRGWLIGIWMQFLSHLQKYS